MWWGYHGRAPQQYHTPPRPTLGCYDHSFSTLEESCWHVLRHLQGNQGNLTRRDLCTVLIPTTLSLLRAWLCHVPLTWCACVKCREQVRIYEPRTKGNRPLCRATACWLVPLHRPMVVSSSSFENVRCRRADMHTDMQQCSSARSLRVHRRATLFQQRRVDQQCFT